MYTSPNMKLQVPVIGADNDPAWQSEIVYTFNKIDSHTHDGTSSGVKIPFNSLNFAQPGGTVSTPNLNNTPLTGLKYLGLVSQGAIAPSVATTGTGILEVVNGELYYISPLAAMKLSGSTAVALTGTAINGITGGIYQISAGNESYTGNTNASSTFYKPGFNPSATTFLANVFTFVTTTAPTGTTSPSANIAAGTFYSVGQSQPGFYIYDKTTAAATGGIGPPLGTAYAGDFSSIGGAPGPPVRIQIGLRGRFYSNAVDKAFPIHVYTVNHNFDGTAMHSTFGIPPYVHVFNGSFFDGTSNAETANNSTYHFVGFNPSGLTSQAQDHTDYYQYALNSANGTMLSVNTPTTTNGFGMIMRYNVQKGSAPAGAQPAAGHTGIAGEASYFWTDAVNNNSAFRSALGVNGVVTSAFTYAFAPTSTAKNLQGVFGTGAQRSDHFIGGLAGPTSSGFVFDVPLFISTSAGFIAPLSNNIAVLGTSLNRWNAIHVNNIESANPLNISGNVNITGSLTVNTSQISNSFVPTQQYTAGNGSNFGLYTNCRVIAAGFFTATAPNGSQSGFSGGSSFGMNVTGVISGVAILANGKFGHDVTINTLNTLPASIAIQATIASITSNNGNDGFAIQACGPVGATQFTIRVMNLTGTFVPTNYTIYFQVMQVN